MSTWKERPHRTTLVTASVFGLVVLGACAPRPAAPPAVVSGPAQNAAPAAPIAASSHPKEAAGTPVGSAPTAPPEAVTTAPAPVSAASPRAAVEPAPEPAVAQVEKPRPAAASRPAAPARAGADWPQFRGPNGMGISADRGLPVSWSATQNIRWKTALPGPGTGSPIVFGNRIFVTAYSGFEVPDQPGSPEQLKRHLIGLDRETGKLLWNTEIPATAPEQGGLREGHGYASSTPVADNERIYAFFGRAGVFAFDHNGRRLWQTSVGDGSHGWGSASSPVLSGSLVLVNASVESGSLVALDRRTGKEVWRVPGMRDSWNTPLLVPLPAGKTELVVAIMGKVLGIDPQTGQSLWNCNTDITWYMVPSMVAQEGVVYCIGGRSGSAALAVRAGGRGDVTSTHRLWTSRYGSNVSSPILHEGHLYWAKDSPAIAYCADARTGHVLYEERIESAGQVYASPVLADGRLYYVGRNGRTYVLPAAPRFEVLAVNELERGTFNASPAVAGSRLFIRSDRNLYCIGAP